MIREASIEVCWDFFGMSCIFMVSKDEIKRLLRGQPKILDNS